ncbi:D-alanine--D-alanine ligase [Campylobacter insulaenigrae]|uniref:D-alanine--D-alanine ligase n=1 Tax=Campylobacter insulaenigrae TaxID=260714 RepID=A0ABY3G2Q4_9BACT|nr:D-alanine--D-alanine ligase [Campylobacter insulaenigrae]MCR6570222.1 D-alanine--D-alanine ligase [Campylobacter insulaenigrae]MCR6572007.1 D-alanine--D-alanine ligase [Campylobacter insulaenigrae]MCR6575833.1 D-alanine--D-alanine ligase [Campylobacter insulaenigrae]MCR6578352.1 D-alanine--D-alanine ligase [Campylobacter insulaenigrae]MCR6581537.1 D-alanine--D-alanine ligase [Campylobacter insulaenigrae]
MIYGIIFGANSYEHEISIVSAVVLKKVLKEQKKFIFCDEKKDFYLIDENKMNAKTFSSGMYKKEKQLILKQGGFFVKNILSEKKLEVDVMINIIHGKDGEDGKISALFDFYGIKYIGPRLEASVISFNKFFTKLYAKSVGVKTLDYKVLSLQNENNEVSFPCILKPARLGSSIGISIVKNEEEFKYAKDVAYEFDDEIVVEQFISNIKEYNLAGCMINDEFCFSVIEEPKKNEILDFEQKYLGFSESNKINEANLDDNLKKKLKESFTKIYNPLFKGALIRCDFFVIDDEVYLNEINPNPGSLANYLFDDFTNTLNQLAHYIDLEKQIKIDYKFLHSINGQKGKM